MSVPTVPRRGRLRFSRILLVAALTLAALGLIAAVLSVQHRSPEPLLPDWRQQVQRRDQRAFLLATALGDQLAHLAGVAPAKVRDWFNAWYENEEPVDPEVDRIVTGAQPNVQRLETLLMRGTPQWTVDETIDTILEFAQNAGIASKVLLLYAVRQWSVGNRSETIEMVALTLRLARVLRSRAGMVQTAVADAIERRALRVVERTLLRAQTLATEHIKPLAALLQVGEAYQTELLNALRNEYLLWWNTLEKIEQGDRQLACSFCSTVTRTRCVPWSFSRAGLAAYFRHLSREHYTVDPLDLKRRLNACYRRLFALARDPRRSPAELVAAIREEKVFQNGPRWQAVFGSPEPFVVAHYEVAARRVLTYAGLHWLLYRRRHGADPPSLEAITPSRSSRHALRDPFGTGWVRYRKLDHGRVVLYSVGWDGVDNRGQPARDWDVEARGDITLELPPLDG